MKKIVRLTESDLIRLVKRVINEQGGKKITPNSAGYYYYQRDKDKYFGDPAFILGEIISEDGTIQSNAKGCLQEMGPMRNYKKLYQVLSNPIGCSGQMSLYKDSRGIITIDFGTPKTSTSDIPYQP